MTLFEKVKKTILMQKERQSSPKALKYQRKKIDKCKQQIEKAIMKAINKGALKFVELSNGTLGLYVDFQNLHIFENYSKSGNTVLINTKLHSKYRDERVLLSIVLSELGLRKETDHYILNDTSLKLIKCG